MAEYVLEQSRVSKLLDTTITDTEFISVIAGHFDYKTARTIRLRVIKSVSDLVEMLTHIKSRKQLDKTERKSRERVNKSSLDRSEKGRRDSREFPSWRGLQKDRNLLQERQKYYNNDNKY